MCYSCHSNCKSYAQMTEFPKVYTTYWGNFRSCGPLKESTVLNRNEFAKVHQLVPKDVCRRDKRKIREIYGMSKDRLKYDHIEMFTTKDGFYVVIISPYSCERNCDEYKDLVSVGWQEIDKLYSDDATTFMVKFSKQKLTQTFKKYQDYYKTLYKSNINSYNYEKVKEDEKEIMKSLNAI